MSKRKANKVLQCGGSSIELQWKAKSGSFMATKNEYKQTIASEESQVEADMINFEVMDGHGYLLSTNYSFSFSLL